MRTTRRAIPIRPTTLNTPATAPVFEKNPFPPDDSAVELGAMLLVGVTLSTDVDVTTVGPLVVGVVAVVVGDVTAVVVGDVTVVVLVDVV